MSQLSGLVVLVHFLLLNPLVLLSVSLSLSASPSHYFLPLSRSLPSYQEDCWSLLSSQWFVQVSLGSEAQRAVVVVTGNRSVAVVHGVLLLTWRLQRRRDRGREGDKRKKRHRRLDRRREEQEGKKQFYNKFFVYTHVHVCTSMVTYKYGHSRI